MQISLVSSLFVHLLKKLRNIYLLILNFLLTIITVSDTFITVTVILL